MSDERPDMGNYTHPIYTHTLEQLDDLIYFVSRNKSCVGLDQEKYTRGQVLAQHYRVIYVFHERDEIPKPYKDIVPLSPPLTHESPLPHLGPLQTRWLAARTVKGKPLGAKNKPKTAK